MWAVLVLALLAGGGQTAQWSFRVEWEHPDPATLYYQLCRGADCVELNAQSDDRTTWSAPLPVLPAGLHQLTLYACNSGGCTPGTPTLWVSVVANQPSVVPEPPPDTPPAPPNETPPPPPPTTKAPPRHPPRV